MATVASTSPEPLASENRHLPPPQRSWLGKLWVICLRLLGIGSGVLSGMIAARYLSEADFGRLNVLLNQVAFWSIVGSFGLNRLLVRLLAEQLANQHPTGVRTLLTQGERLLGVTLVIVASLLFTGFMLGSAWLLGFPISLWQAALTAALMACYGWHQVTGELLRGLHKIQLAGLFGAPPGGVGPLVGSLSLVAVLIVATMNALTLENYLVIQLCLAGILLLPAAYGLRQARDAISTTLCDAHVTPPTISLRELMRLAVPLVVMQALIFLGSQADVWIAGRELTPETVAHFAAAKRISVFITLPLQLAQLTTVASIAQLYAQGERQKLQRLLQRAGTLAFLPATVITLVALFAPAWLLSVMYGSQYAAAATQLQILSVGAWLITATGLCSLTLIMTGHDRAAFPVTVVSAILLVVGGTFAAKYYGAIGLALSSSIVLGFSNVAQWWLARQFVGVWVHPGWSFSRHPARSASAGTNAA